MTTMGWYAILSRDLSDIFHREYSKPYRSRRQSKKYNTTRTGSFMPIMFYGSNEFSPDEPHERSAPRSMIRETSAEAAEARAGTVGGDEREGLEGPSSASGELL